MSELNVCQFLARTAGGLLVPAALTVVALGTGFHCNAVAFSAPCNACLLFLLVPADQCCRAGAGADACAAADGHAAVVDAADCRGGEQHDECGANGGIHQAATGAAKVCMYCNSGGASKVLGLTPRGRCCGGTSSRGRVQGSLHLCVCVLAVSLFVSIGQ